MCLTTIKVVNYEDVCLSIEPMSFNTIYNQYDKFKTSLESGIISLVLSSGSQGLYFTDSKIKVACDLTIYDLNMVDDKPIYSNPLFKHGTDLIYQSLLFIDRDSFIINLSDQEGKKYSLPLTALPLSAMWSLYQIFVAQMDNKGCFDLSFISNIRKENK